MRPPPGFGVLRPAIPPALLLTAALLAALAIACAGAPTATPTATHTPTPSPQPTTAAPIELAVTWRWSAPSGSVIHAIAAADIGGVPYVAVATQSNSSSSLSLVDVSEFAAPTLVGTLDTPFESGELLAEEIEISGGYAYVSLVGPGGGLWVVNVSIPSQPRHVSVLLFEISLLSALHSEDNTVVLAGLLRSASESTALPPLGRPGIVTVDVSEPARPVLAASMAGSVHGSYETAVAVQSGIAYVVGLDRLHVMDVSDPAAIVEVSELARAEDAPIQYTRTVSDITSLGYERAESAPRDVAVHGDHAYLASGSSGLRVIDVSTPSAPVEVGSTEATSLQRLVVAGNWAFAYDFDVPPRPGRIGILLVIDVSNPEMPSVTAELEMTEPQPFGDIATLGGRVYAIDGWLDIVAVELRGG